MDVPSPIGKGETPEVIEPWILRGTRGNKNSRPFLKDPRKIFDLPVVNGSGRESHIRKSCHICLLAQVESSSLMNR
jgi:hypothetical protein